MRNILITIYVLTVLLISVIAKANLSYDNQITLPVQADIYEGRIAFVGNGEFVLYSTNGENDVVYLKAKSNLSQYVGQDVVINGIPEDFKPAYFEENFSLDPLPGNGSEKNAPVIIVIGINAVE